MRLRTDLALVLVTLVWGSSFVVVKNVVRDAPPLAFVFFRFLLATLVCLLLALKRPRTPGLLRDGAIVGSLLAGGMIFQVLGQVETSASKAAFLTGLSVVLTPFAAFARTRSLPSLENGIGISLAAVGFVLLTLPQGGGPINRGDVLVFACGIVFAFYIVEVSLRAGAHDPSWLTVFQLAMVTLVAGILSAIFRAAGSAVELRPIVWEGTFLRGVLYLATIGTVGTFLTQTWAQRHMSATHAAIIFALEPVWAALLAAWLLDERLGVSGLWGGALVLAGIVVSELRGVRSPFATLFPKSKKTKNEGVLQKTEVPSRSKESKD
ncbi:MAG TPA: DMT family transporter [Thermoanaerobaculia bacterium]|jgi:drug/metabolite transporter (DMT)-like permease|nr:DMT family transporter [Thermoanaerobaculia bacterium]